MNFHFDFFFAYLIICDQFMSIVFLSAFYTCFEVGLFSILWMCCPGVAFCLVFSVDGVGLFSILWMCCPGVAFCLVFSVDGFLLFGASLFP